VQDNDTPLGNRESEQDMWLEYDRAALRIRNAAPDLLEHAVLDVAELEYYINNPSAWDSFDEGMSELLRKVVTRAKAAIAKATKP
jgi:hypothetical protein